MSYRDVILATPGLLHYWRLGEAPGAANAVDEKGAQNGLYFNNPFLGIPGAVDDSNTAASFVRASSQYAKLKAGKIVAGLSHWAIEGWFRGVVSGGDQTIYSERAPGGNDILKLETTSGRLRGRYRDDAGTLNDTGPGLRVVRDDVWHHFIWMLDGVSFSIYIDGVRDSVSTRTASLSFTDANLDCRIGADVGDPAAYLDGVVDEVALYNVALSPATVTEHYFASASGILRQGLERLTGGAIVEISRGAYDIWIEVTCQIISARTVWGSLQSDGLLTQAKPGLLECEVYDPDRLLDPTNNQGPYFAMLKPGLWIRLSYDDGATRTVVSYARVDTIEHQIVSQTGRIRANDWVSWLSNIQFPNDVLGTLPSWTGYQNAHSFATALLTQVNASAAVDEFQHPITVESMHGPVYITPKETPFVIGSPGPAIWDHFTEMVESQLYYIWIDRANVLRFANKREPSLPGIRLGLKGPLALDFTGVITASGVLNLIENLGQTNYKQDRKSVDEWGIKSFRMARSWPANAWNPASEDEWLNLVIADRSQPSLEAMPLQIWPTSSAELKQLIAVKAMDLMTMQFDAPDPPINLFARCIGGQISVSAEGWSVELVGWVVINDQAEFVDLLM